MSLFSKQSFGLTSEQKKWFVETKTEPRIEDTRCALKLFQTTFTRRQWFAHRFLYLVDDIQTARDKHQSLMKCFCCSFRSHTYYSSHEDDDDTMLNVRWEANGTKGRREKKGETRLTLTTEKKKRFLRFLFSGKKSFSFSSFFVRTECWLHRLSKSRFDDLNKDRFLRRILDNLMKEKEPVLTLDRFLSKT